MGIGTETITLLLRTLDALDHHTSYDQHSMLSAEELKYTHMQLLATVEAAGKLAEAERTWGEVEKVRGETLRTKAEAEKLEKEAERVAAETEKVKAEADKVTRETQRTSAEAEKVERETERIKAEAEREWKVIERTRVERNVEEETQRTEARRSIECRRGARGGGDATV